MKSRDELIDDLLTLAFSEDVGDGDHTTLSTIPATVTGKQQLIIKEPGVLAGVEMARKVFAKFDADLKMTVFIETVRFANVFEYYIIKPSKKQ
jgi:nicotinate-nucleotide pyrophosphorylase (carboxylating)